MSDRDLDAPWRMAWLGARQIVPGEVVFVGIGAPCQAAMLARRMGNDDMTMIFESGVIGANPDEMPLSTGSPAVAKGAAMITDMLGVFALLQRGGIDLGILSGAEVDAAGNLNSTVIGPYDRPKLRLPGSGVVRVDSVSDPDAEGAARLRDTKIFRQPSRTAAGKRVFPTETLSARNICILASGPD